MKVLVTGATGLLGSNLIRVLIENGHEVYAYVQEGTSTITIDELPVVIIRGDILNFSQLFSASSELEAMIHLAADTSVWPSRNQHTVAVNVEGTRNAIHVAMSARLKRFIHVGTANTFSYGDLDRPGVEGSEYRCHKYGLDYMDSKFRAQKLVEDAIANGLPALIVNPTYMLGPYDSKPSSGQMLMAMYKGKVKGYPIGGKNYICAKDAAIAIANGLSRGRIGESYILGHENLSYKEAFRKMAAVMNIKAPRLPLPRWLVIPIGLINSSLAQLTGRKPGVSLPLARIACSEHYYCSQKAVSELGLPQTPIEEGIRQSFEWMKEHKYLGHEN